MPRVALKRQKGVGGEEHEGVEKAVPDLCRDGFRAEWVKPHQPSVGLCNPSSEVYLVAIYLLSPLSVSLL